MSGRNITDFEQGFLCACHALFTAHGDTSELNELLTSGVPTDLDIKSLDEYDRSLYSYYAAKGSIYGYEGD